MQYHIGREVRCLSNKIRRRLEKIDVIAQMNYLTGTNGFIIMYLAKAKHPVYQKDIELEFGITRSTASKVLTLMEKKDLITRQNVESDARLRQILLTPKAFDLAKKVLSQIDAFEKGLLKGFTDDEVNTLISLLKRVNDNLELKEE